MVAFLGGTSTNTAPNRTTATRCVERTGSTDHLMEQGHLKSTGPPCMVHIGFLALRHFLRSAPKEPTLEECC
jgi:hypothetical protein